MPSIYVLITQDDGGRVIDTELFSSRPTFPLHPTQSLRVGDIDGGDTIAVPPIPRGGYVPNDSPFGVALEGFILDPDSLDVYGHETLVEFASICSSILDTPAYEDDPNVHRMLARIEGLDQPAPDDSVMGYTWGEDNHR